MRSSNWLSAAVAFACVCGGSSGVLGCVGEYVDEDTSRKAEDVAELSQAITYDTVNGTCAESLTLYASPGGGANCIDPISYGTDVWAYWPPSGEWADVYVFEGSCAGKRGWVLKDYVSTACF